MINFLVETKNEYTTHLINIITPLIFEGLQSIYKEATTLSKDNDILKIFQSMLKRIPKWNTSMIQNETNRILNSTHSLGWLNDLIKATIKANIIVLMYNPTMKEQVKVDPKHYQDIKTDDFIHLVYIECAREFWNNPYLMYHNYPPIDIKRNQRDCLNIIKDCTREALRKLLPVHHILQIYLGEDVNIDKTNDHFEKAITEAEEQNLEKMVKKDLSEVDQKHTNTEEKTIGSKILNIIHNDGTDTQINKNLSSTSSDIVSDLAKSIESFNNSIKNDSIKNDNIKNDNIKNDNIDDKIKNILKKDLATDSDMETSLNYSQENNNNKYQEIFSNSNITPKNPNNDNIKSKQKFFSNYMQF